MSYITNKERAAAVKPLIQRFGREHCPNEELETMAADFVTNVCHMLRRDGIVQADQLTEWFESRVRMHNEEAAEDTEE